MTRYTGHKLTRDNLYSGTPSVDIDSARLSRLEKKQPLEQSGRNADPSQISSSPVKGNGVLREDQLSVDKSSMITLYIAIDTIYKLNVKGTVARKRKRSIM